MAWLNGPMAARATLSASSARPGVQSPGYVAAALCTSIVHGCQSAVLLGRL